MSRSFIVARLSGGLGNQLFQYAIGRKMAIKNNALLIIDKSHYNTDENRAARDFRLNHLKIRSASSNCEFQRLMRPNGVIGKAMDFLFRKTISINPLYPRYHKEKHFNFYSDVLNLSCEKGLFIEGYWQCEKYFKDIRPHLLAETCPTRDFSNTFSKPNFKKYKETLDLVKNTKSVSIHVRRGDLVNNPDTFKVHGICSMEYYINAVKLLKNKYSNLNFFIFSDDPVWVKNSFISHKGLFEINKNKKTTQIKIVDTGKDIADLYLMRHCCHHITANSTFSWWGAWLSSAIENKGTIICPEKWFNSTKSFNSKDLIPESWIKL